MKTIKRQIDIPNIDFSRGVSLKYLGNKREIAISERHNAGATIMPISKEEYVLLSSGEVKKFENHAADRTENIRNLEKTMRSLSDLINANISNVEFCRFITLTYKENMTDTERLYNDFRNFNKRFKRYMKRLGHHYEYIVTVEAQGRGAFHLHCIVIFERKAPYIENSKLAEIWRFGFVSVKALDEKVDDIGKYLTAYLTDFPVDDAGFVAGLAGGQVKEVMAEGKNKRIIKGARLKLLPVGIRIYRYSKGIKKPVVKTKSYGEALQELSDDGYSKVSEYALEIQDVERDFKTRYIKQIYKKHINTSRSEADDRENERQGQAHADS